MAGRPKSALMPALAAVLALLGAVSCGGGETDNTTAAPQAPAAGDRQSPTPGKDDAGEDDFKVPGGDNSIQEFGGEADDSERRMASAVLETYMRARARGDYETACANLAASAYERLADLVPEAGGGCASVLTAIDERTSPRTRANTMAGPIGSLRVEGERAFALYHGTRGSDYTIQMAKEGGTWKVAALTPFELS